MLNIDVIDGELTAGARMAVLDRVGERYVRLCGQAAGLKAKGDRSERGRMVLGQAAFGRDDARARLIAAALDFRGHDLEEYAHHRLVQYICDGEMAAAKGAEG